MEFERVKLDIDGAVGTLTLNHPEVMNAVSPEMLGGLMQAMDAVACWVTASCWRCHLTEELVVVGSWRMLLFWASSASSSSSPAVFFL